MIVTYPYGRSPAAVECEVLGCGGGVWQRMKRPALQKEIIFRRASATSAVSGEAQLRAQHGGESGGRGRERRAQAMNRHIFTYMRLGLNLSRASLTRDGITCIEGHVDMYFQQGQQTFFKMPCLYVAPALPESCDCTSGTNALHSTTYPGVDMSALRYLHRSRCGFSHMIYMSLHDPPSEAQG